MKSRGGVVQADEKEPVGWSVISKKESYSICLGMNRLVFYILMLIWFWFQRLPL